METGMIWTDSNGSKYKVCSDGSYAVVSGIVPRGIDSIRKENQIKRQIEIKPNGGAHETRMTKKSRVK